MKIFKPNPEFEKAPFELQFVDKDGAPFPLVSPRRFTEPPPTNWGIPSVFAEYCKRCEVFSHIETFEL